MPKHTPAPPDHKELRAIWLSPKERADLEKAAAKRDWSMAKYAEKAILEKVKRDLAPPVPDFERIMEQMRDLPEGARDQAMALLHELLRAHQAEPKP